MLELMNNPNIEVVLQSLGAAYLILSILSNLPFLNKTKAGMAMKTVVADVGPILALLGSLLGKKVVPAVPPTDEQSK